MYKPIATGAATKIGPATMRAEQSIGLAHIDKS